jgi:hypothetical protein
VATGGGRCSLLTGREVSEVEFKSSGRPRSGTVDIMMSP